MPIAFLASIAVLIFALWHAQERSTRIWIVACIALNAGAIGMAASMGDYGAYQNFEQTTWSNDLGGLNQ